ncbi:hypothetical protein [Arthrobacter sp. CJ23]|uniref:hypothetical protein n=1 Tax=Arthrobacter sp. CJ23 TaxID=2972479 RepID=UPI00215B90CF|nr:hypothetical protein [Arthrobacter sp. CJ23]UVJ40248.1 hypothetical protein NVV90_03410 [Arthrobacter sp. CJ23]
MAYDWTEKQISQYDYPAMATVYRLKFEHEARRAAYLLRRLERYETAQEPTK